MYGITVNTTLLVHDLVGHAVYDTNIPPGKQNPV